jgi:uncharacterized protein
MIVEPVNTYAANVMSHLTIKADARRYYDKARHEAVFIIDTSGDVYSNGDAYDRTLRHGNVFSEPWAAMKMSAGYAAALAESRARVSMVCPSCRFFGSCSGYFMAEATPEQRWSDANGVLRCGVAAPIQHCIVGRLREIGLLDEGDELRLAELRRRVAQAEPADA